MDSIILPTALVMLIGVLFAGLLLMPLKKMAVISAFFQSQGLDPYSI